MTQLPTVAVIGAGSSGITTAKALHERGVPFTCFEASDRIGGNWVFGNANGMSAAYRGLHINTSRERMEFADFPMPSDLPDYPHHAQIAAYFESYVDHFGFRDRIRFSTKVTRAEKDATDGVWRLTLEDGTVERFDALVVANGHHWDPRWPEPAFPGHDTTEIEQLHAHSYVDEELFRDRDVVVLGMGNSAMDLAVESSYVAKHTWLSARRGAWIIPKYAFGRPFDQLPNDPRVPFAIRRRIAERIVLATTGRPERYGLPRPDHGFGEAHPTVSGRILDRIGHGTITPRPNIARLHAREVEFADGSRVPCDVVVYCTGYKITFPFFAEDFVAAPDNRIDLFRRVFHPEHDDLFFVGLLQPLGAVMPLAEVQARWIASYLRGEYALPDRAAVRRDIGEDAAAMSRRYVTSKRHTIQVDFEAYLLGLERERAAGARRARALGHRLPVPPRARAGQEARAA